MNTQPKRPPADRGQGRKSLQGAGESPVIRIRGSQELADKVKRNGPEWARTALENTPELEQVPAKWYDPTTQITVRPPAMAGVD